MKLTRYRSVPSLRIGQKNLAGRNSKGKITVRHRGGGHKQANRHIDWTRLSGSGFVIGLEYDPLRNSNLVKLYHPATNNFSYVTAFEGVKLFQEVSSYTNVVSKNKAAKLLNSGDTAPLSFFESGDFIHNVAAYSGQSPIFARAAGTFCQVMSQMQQKGAELSQNTDSSCMVQVRLPSGSQRLISSDAKATLGIVAESLIKRSNLIKAGRSRWLGWRPSVRGVARNPVDHPHGGGQGKTSGGRPSVTFKSWPTKGQPTRNPKRNNSLILTTRKQKTNYNDSSALKTTLRTSSNKEKVFFYRNFSTKSSIYYYI